MQCSLDVLKGAELRDTNTSATAGLGVGLSTDWPGAPRAGGMRLLCMLIKVVSAFIKMQNGRTKKDEL